MRSILLRYSPELAPFPCQQGTDSGEVVVDQVVQEPLPPFSFQECPPFLHPLPLNVLLTPGNATPERITSRFQDQDRFFFLLGLFFFLGVSLPLFLGTFPPLRRCCEGGYCGNKTLGPAYTTKVPPLPMNPPSPTLTSQAGSLCSTPHGNLPTYVF